LLGLITLSDGKPDDHDGYRGEYGIEDTRDYLPDLYGPAAYTLVDDVRSLPLKVSDIYRRLTT